MVTYTTTYSFAKPTVGDDEDAWGGYLNGNFDTLESLLKGTTALTAIDVTGNITVGGTVDGRDIAVNIPASLGTAGQVLTVNSGATAAEWADAGGGNTFDTSIIFEGATADAFETTLTVTDPTADRTITFPDATGNVAVFSTAPTAAIADGTSGQVLTTNGSGVLSFADAGGGQTTKISTTTVSTAVSSVEMTLPTSGYTHLLLHFQGVLPSTNNVDFDFRLSDTSGTTWEPIYWARENVYSSTSASQSSGFDCQFNYNGLSNAGDIEASGFIQIHIPTVTDATSFQWSLRYNQATTNQNQGSIGWANLAGTGVTANHCRFMMSSGNIASGVFTLYGVA